MRAPALALFCLVACASTRGAEGGPWHVLEMSTGGARFRIEYLARDEAAARQVAGVLPAALACATRWGPLSSRLTIVVRPTHGALEVAAHRERTDWLRAWARFDTIDLQSPLTWRIADPKHEQLEELLAHELTHCVMYQVAGTARSWAREDIPLWFREGMASVTAGQGRYRIGIARLADYYAAGGAPLPAAGHGGRATAGGQGDPLVDPGPLYRTHSDLVYGAAHLAFAFLVERYGDGRIRALLAHVREGRTFATAFREAMGIGADQFEAEFRRYVAWRGWAPRPPSSLLARP